MIKLNGSFHGHNSTEMIKNQYLAYMFRASLNLIPRKWRVMKINEADEFNSLHLTANNESCEKLLAANIINMIRP